jgi:flagellar L-ring protein precursor FlgH
MNKVMIMASLAFAALAGPTQATESLYREGKFQSLTSDRRGSRVGDLITVLVYENSSAQSSADTTSDRSANIGVSVGIGTQSNPTRNRLTAQAGFNNGMEGMGRTARAGRLLAQVTVQIQEILANGDLRLAGEQFLEINDERQQIRLEGRVRAQDVQDNNVVLSSRLADARISYQGDGVLGDKQKPSWWQRLLTALGF